MRLTDLIRRCRKKLADEGYRQWTDVQLARELDYNLASLWRLKAGAHESYGQVILDLSAVDNAERWVLQDSDEIVWHLPSWVYRVLEVRRLSGTITNGVVPFASGATKNGWQFTGDSALLIKGQASAFDIRLRVQKTPARMIRGAFPLKGPDLAQVIVSSVLPLETKPAGAFLDVTESFDTEFEKGGMIGSRIEVTSSSASADPRGIIATVREQERLYDGTLGAYVNVLTVIPRYPSFVQAGDTFESHAQIEDVDLELLILQTVNGCHDRDHNIAGKAVLEKDLAREQKRFHDSLVPREGNQPQFIETEDDGTGFIRRDLERDPLFS